MIRTIAIVLILFICIYPFSSEETVAQRQVDTIPLSDNYVPSPSPVKGKRQTFDCSKCTYIVPPKKYQTDGAALGLKPGDYICLDASIKYGQLKFVNLKGTPDNPITIVNCGGPVHIEVPPDKKGCIKTEKSEYFRITGVGNEQSPYGIILSGSRSTGLHMDYLSTNFEIDHLEIYNIGFAGIMAKTDPSCDSATVRGHFTMRDISFHDNYVHDTGGEGFYIGNSFHDQGMRRKCGIRMPHDIEGVKIFNNVVKNSGWDGIQLGCATKGAEVYNNTVENFGVRDIANQRGGIQLGGGTGGLCYNNKIISGKGNGLIVMGIGDNIIFNNLIVNAGRNAVYCDDPQSTGTGFKFINNTIINPGMYGILIYADQVDLNVVANNIIVGPGLLKEKGKNAYVSKLNDKVKVDMSNNYFAESISEIKFKNAEDMDFTLSKSSPAIDKGRDVSNFNIGFDIRKEKRPRGEGFDIGAYEQ